MAECHACGREAGVNRVYCDEQCYKSANFVKACCNDLKATKALAAERLDVIEALQAERTEALEALDALRGQIVALIEERNETYRRGRNDGARIEREGVVKTLFKGNAAEGLGGC